MTGRKLRPKLPLNEAWKHYWTVFFPGGKEWQVDLESEIRKRIYDPRDTHGFLSSEDPKPEVPAWASDLGIFFQGNSVTFSYLSRDIASVPLFVIQNRELISNWANKNPMVSLANLQSVTDRDLARCQGFLIAAARECGSIVRGRLLAMLKETKVPKFDIYCRLHNDVFSAGSKLPLSGISAFSDVDIIQNELTDNLRLPKLSDVHLELRRLPASTVKASKSFDRDDDILIEEMKSLIDAKKEKSVRQAAMAVLAKARKMGDAKDDSVQQRLQRKFAEKYPRYIGGNRRSGLNARK